MIEIIKMWVETVEILLDSETLPDWIKTVIFFAISGIVVCSAIAGILVGAKKAVKVLSGFKYRLFVNRNMYPYFQGVPSHEIYEAIKYYIPTRYARIDHGNEDEPTPENFTDEQERASHPLLLNRFLDTEFDSRFNHKFYFILADCGMGKTTFLINLFFYTLKKRRHHPCKYINMASPGVINAVRSIKENETILLLDALDENDDAMNNYKEFMRELEEEARRFYCVVITSRTNFFAKAEDEQLPGIKQGTGISQDKIVKFYITPFTDTDISRFLKRRYPWNRKKRRRALEIINNNKNLASRPMLLKFMDDLLNEDFSFEYDYQLYEKLFDLWISRECEKRRNGTFTLEEAKKAMFDECLAIAKAIYRNWKTTGVIGASFEKLQIKIPNILNIKLKGHALINRTSDGIYKFAHKSYWEYLLAYLVLHDIEFSKTADISLFDRASSFVIEMVSKIDPYFTALFLGSMGETRFRKVDMTADGQIYIMKDKKPHAKINFAVETIIFCMPNTEIPNTIIKQVASVQIRVHSIGPIGFVAVPLDAIIQNSPILTHKRTFPPEMIPAIKNLLKSKNENILKRRCAEAEWEDDYYQKMVRNSEEVLGILSYQGEDFSEYSNEVIHKYLKIIDGSFWI